MNLVKITQIHSDHIPASNLHKLAANKIHNLNTILGNHFSFLLHSFCSHQHLHQGDSCSKLCSSLCSVSLVPEHRYNLVHEDAYRICNGLLFDVAVYLTGSKEMICFFISAFPVGRTAIFLTFA